MKPLARFFCLLCAAILSNAAAAACVQKTIAVQGIDRSGYVCTPSVATAGPVPTVLAFHGRDSNGKSMADATRIHEAWPEALVVYLDGLTGNPGPNDPTGSKPGWQIDPGDLGDRDVAFADATLDAAIQYFNADPKRVFAVGHSNGARMVGILWSLRPQRFKALAFSAAQADTLIDTAEPRSVFMGMGLADDVVPFASQRPSIQYAATRFGIPCAGSTEAAGITLVRNNNGIELMPYIHSGGHVWPAEQTALIVAFFKWQPQ